MFTFNVSHRSITRKMSMNINLMRKLTRLIRVFDFSRIIINKQVATLYKGTQFGELALNTNDVRQASVRVRPYALVAYLDRHEYSNFLKKANMKDKMR